MTQETGLIVREPDLGLSFVKTPQEALDQLREFQAFVANVMVEGVDLGTIPGTPKPTLLKPGAEKVCEIYGLAPHADVINRVEDWERGFFHYEIKCRLVSKRSGQVVAEGVGSCNSKEARYRWRDRKPECEECGMELRRSWKANVEEWYCWKAKGGCGATYPLDQVKPGGKVENDDPYTLVNTILKMAKKRALVDAALSATRSSGIFTQDLEDYHDSSFGGETVEAKARPAPPQSETVTVKASNGTTVQAPQCPEHHTARRNKRGDGWYCPRQTAKGYCDWRANDTEGAMAGKRESGQ